MKSDSALWERLSQFEIDDQGTAFPFSRRLARENGWTYDFTLRVIEEYKKFVYLACISDLPVTPSDEVDQVWHLHLVFTRNYWHIFCGKVLQQDLHHGPTKGGQKEDEKFTDWYERTKELYEEEFDLRPPEDIWPDSTVRFTRPLEIEKIDTSRYWIVPKIFPQLNLNRFLMLFIPAAFLAGCSVGNNSVEAILSNAIALVVFILIVFIVRRKNKRKRKGKGGNSGTGCSGCNSSSGCGSGCGGGGCGG